MSTPFAPPHQPKTSRPCGPDLGFPFSTDPASTFHPDTLLACLLPEYRLEYMEPLGYLPDGRPDPSVGSRPVEVDIAYEIERA